MKKQFTFKKKESNYNPFIDVRFFNVTDGLDDYAKQIFNERMTEIKNQFELEMKKLGEVNFE